MAALLCAWCWETQAYAVRCCRGVVLAAPIWMVRGGGWCSCQHTPGVASPTIDACRAKMRGRKPEPELEYDVQPHPCDRIGLQLSRCGDHVNQPYVCCSAPPISAATASVGPAVLSHTPGGTHNKYQCIKKAKRALLKCLDTYWSDSQRPPMLEGIYARIDGDLVSRGGFVWHHL